MVRVRPDPAVQESTSGDPSGRLPARVAQHPTTAHREGTGSPVVDAAGTRPYEGGAR